MNRDHILCKHKRISLSNALAKKLTIPFEECPIFPYKEDNKVHLQWKPGQKNYYGVPMTTLTVAWTYFPGSGSSTPCNPTRLKFGGKLNDVFFLNGKFFLQGHSKSDFQFCFGGFSERQSFGFLLFSIPKHQQWEQADTLLWHAQGAAVSYLCLRAQHSPSCCLTFWARDWEGEEGMRPITNEGIYTWALSTLEKHLLMCLPGNPSWR